MANKNKLADMMSKRNPHKAVTLAPILPTIAPPTVTPVDLTPTKVKPNGDTEPQAVKPNALKGIRKHRRTGAKDAFSPFKTERHSFEITVELRQQLKEAVAAHRAATGKKTSESAVIRTALTRYLKGEL